MRFKGYVNEGVDMDELIWLIEDKCSLYLKDILKGSKYDMLWSGRNKTEEWFEGEVRKNRRPLDSSVDDHNKVDTLFNKKFGFRARSNVIFCSGDVDQTTHYGYEYSIWPIGSYKYVYSPTVYDFRLTLESEEMYQIRHNKEISETERQSEIDRLIQDVFVQFVGGKDRNIYKAIDTGNEVMVHCVKYIAVNEKISRLLKKELWERNRR